MKRRWNSEEKARIVIEGLTTHVPMSELCRKHNVNHAQYYAWRNQFLEAGKRGLAHGASSSEKALQEENDELKQLIAELSIANNAFKKTLMSGRGGKQ